MKVPYRVKYIHTNKEARSRGKCHALREYLYYSEYTRHRVLLLKIAPQYDVDEHTIATII